MGAPAVENVPRSPSEWKLLGFGSSTRCRFGTRRMLPDRAAEWRCDPSLHSRVEMRPQLAVRFGGRTWQVIRSARRLELRGEGLEAAKWAATEHRVLPETPGPVRN